MSLFDESVIAGVYMDRSLADFVRACERYVEEETLRPDCDSHLISILCDAVRLARETMLLCDAVLLTREMVLMKQKAQRQEHNDA